MARFVKIDGKDINRFLVFSKAQIKRFASSGTAY